LPEPGEQLRAWPVCRTTGYEFANDVTALFVDARGELPLTEFYQRFTGLSESYHQVAQAAKLEQAQTAFRVELNKLRSLWDPPGLERAVASPQVYRSWCVTGLQGQDKRSFSTRLVTGSSEAGPQGVHFAGHVRRRDVGSITRRPQEVSMHPLMMIALSHELDGDRRRARKQTGRRSPVLQRQPTGVTNSTTRTAGHQFAQRLLVVSRLLTPLS
jgi:hypothetical protein